MTKVIQTAIIFVVTLSFLSLSGVAQSLDFNFSIGEDVNLPGLDSSLNREMLFCQLGQIMMTILTPGFTGNDSSHRYLIYLFGDSITESSFKEYGWGAALQEEFRRAVDIKLRGYSGFNTRWALKVIKRVFATDGSQQMPIAVTIFFGANDAVLNNTESAFQQVPLDEYKQNLRDMFKFIKGKWPSIQVIFITPGPIDEEGRIQHPYFNDTSGRPDRTNEAAGLYAKACLEVAAELQAPSIDLWTKIQNNSSDWRKSCLYDGLHFTTKCQEIVRDEVIGMLKYLGISQATLPVDVSRPKSPPVHHQPYEPLD